MPELIGIIGAKGDLGKQLAKRARKQHIALLLSDLKDPAAAEMSEVLARCDIVHFCIPAAAFRESIELRPGQLIVLHDSIMQTSQALNEQWVAGKASIVHLLMNKPNSAVILEGTEQARRLTKHLEQLGFTVQALPAKTHDRMIARSQAPLALLLELLPELDDWHNKGLLTPSSEDLRATLHRRAMNWTPSVISALRQNPELSDLLTELSGVITKIEE